METPGKNVTQKAGLNRSILSTGWYVFEQHLKERAMICKVPAPYTSQRCFQCGNWRSLEAGHRRRLVVSGVGACGCEHSKEPLGVGEASIKDGEVLH